MSSTKLRLGRPGALVTQVVRLPDGEATPWDGDTKLTVIGQEAPRLDAAPKVTGRAAYTTDIALPGMLFAKVLRSHLPCAEVTAIDLTRAEACDGVRAVLPLVRPGDRILFAGQDIAAVAAQSAELAERALQAIVWSSNARPFVVETKEALSPGAPRVHAQAVSERSTEGDEPGTRSDEAAKTLGNVRPLPVTGHGEVERALAMATHVHRATYTTAVQEHAALEPHGFVATWPSKERLLVYASTQGIFSVRDELAEIFGLRPSHVEVRAAYVGGGFGAKFGAAASGSRLGYIAAELARRAGAPVRLVCTRHEEHVCTGNRPDAIQTVTLAADAKKNLTAIDVVSHGTAGIATGAGVGRNAIGLYTRCRNARITAHDVFTHAGPATAMRAPGHPQGAFALELALDEFASTLGVDPLAFRIAHEEHPVRREQFVLGRSAFAWSERRAESRELRARKTRIRRGAGVAASIWGDFGRANTAMVTVTVERDGSLEVRNGVQDIGTGIATVLALVAAEVFRRPAKDVRVRYGRSDLGASVGSGGSQTTASVAPAVRNAAEAVRRDLARLAASALGATDPRAITWGPDGRAHFGGASLSFEDVCKRMAGDAISHTASRPKTYGSHPARFMDQDQYQIAGVQFAAVEVDTWTGVVTVRKILALHDAGRTMNALTLRSQIYGGVIMGTSYALCEERVMDPISGRMLNPNLEQYKIAGMRDIPEIEVIVTEVFVGNNNTGAVGIGEPATIPTAAAIANAVYDALGVPVRKLPLVPAHVLEALHPGLGG